jgi:hypothetical protein
MLKHNRNKIAFLTALVMGLFAAAPVSAKNIHDAYGRNAYYTGTVTAGSITIGTVTTGAVAIGTTTAGTINTSRINASQYVAVTSATAIVALSTPTAVPITSGYVVVASSGGAVILESDPQLAAGVSGQLVIIQGSSDTNTVGLADSNGLYLAGAATLGANDTITLIYSPAASGWVEIARSGN